MTDEVTMMRPAQAPSALISANHWLHYHTNFKIENRSTPIKM
jgi:hypothetical protein